MSASASDGISIREFARRSGLDEKQVRRGIEAGRLALQADGKLNAALVETEWRRAPKPRADKPQNVHAAVSAPIEVTAGETPAAAVERIIRESGATLSLADAEKLKENYIALLRQLEYDTKSGLVVAVSEVAALVGAEYAQIRTKLLAIPAEQAPRLHRLKAVTEIQDALMSMIVEALEGLTRDGTADPA